MPDGIATLYADYQRTIKGSLQEPEEFYLEPFLRGST